MSFDVFISYSSKDKPVADATCAALEAAQVRCWIAPRDVLPGADWSAAIIDALDSCRAIVLIFSANANESPQIRNEIARAVHRGLPIIPVRIENIDPVKSLAYFMGAVHWLDALSPPLEQHLQRLVASVKTILKLTYDPAGDAVASAPPVADRNPPRSPSLPLPRTVAIAVVAAILAGSAAFYGMSYWRARDTGRGDVSQTQPQTQAQQQAETAALAERLLARFNTVIPASPFEFRKARARVYAESKANKAQAVSLQPPGAWRTASRPTDLIAEEAALENCQVFHGQPCVLVAINDRVLPDPPDGNWLIRDMPRVRYAGQFDPAQIPGGFRPPYRPDIAGYAAAPGPKAVAYHPGTLVFVVTGAESQRAAEEKALDQCNRDPHILPQDGQCFLYAVGNQVVLPQRRQKPMS